MLDTSSAWTPGAPRQRGKDTIVPYINQDRREALEPAIEALAAQIRELGGDYEGDLNYTLTRLCIEVMPATRYVHIARITGVLENVKQEFYRRLAGPYEDEKIEQSGDVRGYEHAHV